jgi:hypothetical protein
MFIKKKNIAMTFWLKSRDMHIELAHKTFDASPVIIFFILDLKLTFTFNNNTLYLG